MTYDRMYSKPVLSLQRGRDQPYSYGAAHTLLTPFCAGIMGAGWSVVVYLMAAWVWWGLGGVLSCI